jgi:hypothetical protein
MRPDKITGVIEELVGHWGIGHSIALMAGILVALGGVLPAWLFVRRLVCGPRKSLRLERDRWVRAAADQEKAKGEWKNQYQEVFRKHNDLVKKYNYLFRKFNELNRTAKDQLDQIRNRVVELEQEKRRSVLAGTRPRKTPRTDSGCETGIVP